MWVRDKVVRVGWGVSRRERGRRKNMRFGGVCSLFQGHSPGGDTVLLCLVRSSIGPQVVGVVRNEVVVRVVGGVKKSTASRETLLGLVVTSLFALRHSGLVLG